MSTIDVRDAGISGKAPDFGRIFGEPEVSSAVLEKRAKQREYMMFVLRNLTASMTFFLAAGLLLCGMHYLLTYHTGSKTYGLTVP